MTAVRWAAAAVTVLMSLMNLPLAFDRGDTPAAVAWAATVVGVLGLAAAAGLLLRTTWGRPAVLAVGIVNLAGAVAAVVAGWDGAPVGLVVSALIVVLGWFSAPRPAVTTA